MGITKESPVEEIPLGSLEVERTVLMRVEAVGTVILRAEVERAVLGNTTSPTTRGRSGVLDHDTTEPDRRKSYTISITDYKESFLSTTVGNTTATKVIVITGIPIILVTIPMPRTYLCPNHTETQPLMRKQKTKPPPSAACSILTILSTIITFSLMKLTNRRSPAPLVTMLLRILLAFTSLELIAMATNRK